MVGIWKTRLLISVCFIGLACWCNEVRAQDYVNPINQDYINLPDDPGQMRPTVDAATLNLLDVPGQRVKATGDTATLNLPDEPGLMMKATVDTATFNLPDEPGQATKPTGDSTTKPKVDTTTGVPQREATWRSIPGDFLHDQKSIWLFPVQLAKGRHLLPTLIVVGGTAGLIFADSHAMPYFTKHAKNWDDFNDVFDPLITTGEVIALPAGLMVAGYIRRDDREVNTALLATEAYADTLIPNLVLKGITRRQRPADIPPGGSFTGTFFNGGKSPFKGSSFPSGHSTAVWSVATVVAERYRHRGKPWIPVLAYTMAVAISCSRITDSAHFPSDVWLGSAMGFTIAKYQTLRPR